MTCLQGLAGGRTADIAVVAPLLEHHCVHLLAQRRPGRGRRRHVAVVLQPPVRQLRHRTPDVPPPVAERFKCRVLLLDRGPERRVMLSG